MKDEPQHVIIPYSWFDSDSDSYDRDLKAQALLANGSWTCKCGQSLEVSQVIVGNLYDPPMLRRAACCPCGVIAIVDFIYRAPVDFGAAIEPPAASVVLPVTPRQPDSGNSLDVLFFVDDAEWTDAVARQDLDGLGLRINDDYYRSMHWELLRREFLTGRCAMCERTDVPTTLHHRGPRAYSRMGQETAEDLTEVCRVCHGRHHELRRAA